MTPVVAVCAQADSAVRHAIAQGSSSRNHLFTITPSWLRKGAAPIGLRMKTDQPRRPRRRPHVARFGVESVIAEASFQESTFGATTGPRTPVTNLSHFNDLRGSTRPLSYDLGSSEFKILNDTVP